MSVYISDEFGFRLEERKSLTNKTFTDAQAEEWLGVIRWGKTPRCPRCSSIASYRSKTGDYKCRFRACKIIFSSRVNTPVERSHIPFYKWLAALHFYPDLSVHHGGIRSLSYRLAVTYKTAWAMMKVIQQIQKQSRIFRISNGRTAINVESVENFLKFGSRPPLATRAYLRRKEEEQRKRKEQRKDYEPDYSASIDYEDRT